MENIDNKTSVRIKGSLKRKRVMNTVVLVIPAVIFAVFILSAIFAPLLAPYDPLKNDTVNRFTPPAFMKGGSSAHLLGTDSLGRDILSRIIYGSRISLEVGLVITFINTVIAAIIGIISGYYRGRVDSFLMRVTDVTMAFPGILIQLILASVLKPGFGTIVIALVITGWAMLARMIRGEALRLRYADFIAQASINGCSPARIMIRHFLPNVMNTIVVVATMSIPGIIMMESMLSFLGIGFPPPTPSWGSIVSDGRSQLEYAWWIAVFPSIAIALLFLSMTLLGNWLRDRMDPRLRQL